LCDDLLAGTDIGAFRAQSLQSPAQDSPISRVSGQGYSTNPYYDGDPTSVRSKIWAYGLRNPFRFALKTGGAGLVQRFLSVMSAGTI